MCCAVSWNQCATVYVYESYCANDSSLKFCTTRTLYFTKSCVRCISYRNISVLGQSLSLGLCPQGKNEILLLFLSIVSLEAVSILATITVVAER